MPKITLSCKQCSTEFQGETKEVERRKKEGRNYFFCSRSCSTKYNNSRRSLETRQKISDALSKRSSGNLYALKGNFTRTLRQVYKRDKKHEMTEDFLQTLWDKQEGKCALSGIQLQHYDFKTKKAPNNASLDRIDSSRGYLKDNVQFVAYSLNLAKVDFDNDQFKLFIESLRQ